MNFIHEWGGLGQISYIIDSDVSIFYDNSPEYNTVALLTLAPGKDWAEIPFLPETGLYTMGKNPSNPKIYDHRIVCELDTNSWDNQKLIDSVLIGRYLVKFTDNNNKAYILGTLDFPGKFGNGNLNFGTNQLSNVSNLLQFEAITNKRPIQLL